MQLRQLVDPNLVFTDLACGDRDQVLRALADRLESRGAVADAGDLYRKLVERENLGSTAIGKGVAIPHCKLPDLERVIVTVGLTPQGVSMETPDQVPVRLFFLVVSPEGSPAEHLQSLAAISKWLKDGRKVEGVQRLSTSAEISAVLCEEEGGGGG